MGGSGQLASLRRRARGDDNVVFFYYQMELVNHNTKVAIVKLEKAYRLNSSAAALALGRSAASFDPGTEPIADKSSS